MKLENKQAMPFLIYGFAIGVFVIRLIDTISDVIIKLAFNQMKKLSILLIALAFISCSSFSKKSSHKRIIATYDFLIASDSIINGCKKCDSLRIEKDKKLANFDAIRNF